MYTYRKTLSRGAYGHDPFWRISTWFHKIRLYNDIIYNINSAVVISVVVDSSRCSSKTLQKGSWPYAPLDEVLLYIVFTYQKWIKLCWNVFNNDLGIVRCNEGLQSNVHSCISCPAAEASQAAACVWWQWEGEGRQSTGAGDKSCTGGWLNHSSHNLSKTSIFFNLIGKRFIFNIITLQLCLRVDSSFWWVLTSQIVFTGRKLECQILPSVRRELRNMMEE